MTGRSCGPTGQFRTDTRSYHQLLKLARQWPERIWAVEGANGIGRPLTQRLLASGERVLDVPAKLAARARVFDTGQGRKTDAADAHAIVMVALRDKGLREVSPDPDLTVLRMLCDRRDELSRARAQALNRLHRLFLDLIPGGAPVKKSTSQYQALVATVRPRDLAGKTRRRMAAEELEDLHRLDAKLKAMKAELKTAVQAWAPPDGHPWHRPSGRRADPCRRRRRGPLPGPQPLRILDRHRPIDASSGQHLRHRLSRAGNRRLNHVLYMAAFVQLRHDTPGRAYYRRKLAAGKTPMEAMRCLRAPVRRRLPAAGRRRQSAHSKGRPGRAPRGVFDVQRGRPVPGHRPFGSATSRTRTPDATPRPASPRGPGPRRRHPAAARPRCQRAAPHRTDDVDTDQRRRTLNSDGAMPLDKHPS